MFSDKINKCESQVFTNVKNIAVQEIFYWVL